MPHADLVTSRQAGRFIYYADAMYGLIGYLTDHWRSESSGNCAPADTGKTGVAKKPPVVAFRQRKTSA